MNAAFDILASQEAKRLGVHRTTLVAAIKAGACDGEERDGRWYTSSAAAAAWYASHYRHAGALYSDTVGSRWDDARLLAMLERGVPVEDIAKAFGRTPKATQIKLAHLRAAGKAPTAADIKLIRRKKEKIAEAKAVLAAEGTPLDWYQQRRQEDRDGRVRLHLHPDVKAAFEKELRRLNVDKSHGERITLAKWVTWAGLAAVADPGILEKGLHEAENLGKGKETVAARRGLK